MKKAREAGTVDALTLKDKDTGLPFKVRAFMRLDRSGKVSAVQYLSTAYTGPGETCRACLHSSVLGATVVRASREKTGAASSVQYHTG